MQVLETGLLTVGVVGWTLDHAGVVDRTLDHAGVGDWTLDCRCCRLDS